MEPGPESVIRLEYQGRFAILTIDNAKKLNALTREQYYELAQKLREVANHNEVYVTVILGKGRHFSAYAPIKLQLDSANNINSGADVGAPRPSPSRQHPDLHKEYLQTFVAFNLNICHAFSTHPKVLVVGLNGPAVGLSAALVAHADFIYCTPHTFLLTPFSSLGLEAEGGASRALVQRLGIAKANEALLMSKRIPAEDLDRCGFVNAIVDTGKGDDQRLREVVMREVTERLGEHLVGESLAEIKRLIRKPEIDAVTQGNVHEVFAGLDRWLTGVPQSEFRKVARGEKRHKL